MSQICNKKSTQQLSTPGAGSVLDRVDAPVATGSAHFMRAGAELHLLHADLELGDIRLAEARVSSACAALSAAVAAYEESHRLAIELGFYEAQDERLSARHGHDTGVGELLGEAQSHGLIDLDGAVRQVLEREYLDGGDRAAFTSFIAEVKVFGAELSAFDRDKAAMEPVAWQQFAWMTITMFGRLRVRGQAIAVVNTYTSPQQARSGA